MDTREGRACRVRTPSASVPPSDATSASLPFRTPPSLGQHNEIRRDFTEMCVTQFLKSSVPLCLRALRVDRPEAQGCLPAPRAEAARVHRVASGRLTRSARSHGDTEMGFEVGSRAASPTGEGREMIGLSYWPNRRVRRFLPCTLAKTDCGVARYSGRRSHIGLCQTCACAASAFRRRTRQARPSRFVHLLALSSTMKSGGMLQRCVQPSF